MQRGCVRVRDIHGYLSHTVFLDKPANSLGSLQRAGNIDRIAVFVFHDFAGNRITLAFRATFFAYVESNGVGTTGGSGIQIVVHRDEEVTGTDGGGTALGHFFCELARTEIGFPFSAGNTLFQCLVLALTAVGQVAAFGFESGVFVAEHRNVEFLAHLLG